MRAELSSKRRQLQVDTGWFFGYLGDVQVVYMDGRTSDESYARYLAAVARDIDERAEMEEAVAILYHVPQPAALTAKRRALLADLLREREDLVRRNTIAYAFATTSTVVRGGLKVLFWLAPPPYPNSVVASPRAGFEFLVRHATTLDPAALTQRYEALLAVHAADLGTP